MSARCAVLRYAALSALCYAVSCCVCEMRTVLPRPRPPLTHACPPPSCPPLQEPQRRQQRDPHHSDRRRPVRLVRTCIHVLRYHQHTPDKHQTPLSTTDRPRHGGPGRQQMQLARALLTATPLPYLTIPTPITPNTMLHGSSTHACAVARAGCNSGGLTRPPPTNSFHLHPTDCLHSTDSHAPAKPRAPLHPNPPAFRDSLGLACHM